MVEFTKERLIEIISAYPLELTLSGDLAAFALRLLRERDEAEEAIRRLAWRKCRECGGDGITGHEGDRPIACEGCYGDEDRRGDGWHSDSVENIDETMNSPAVRRALERGRK